MTFAHPWMLLGALAALIPLLVHLFDRRRPRPHPFAALAFVLKSQKRTASRLKLKRLLLYILRTTLLLALPLALARPEWRRQTSALASAHGPAATAIILDTSLSMRWTEGGTSLFARAREEARDALKDLTPEEPATVVVCGDNPAPPPSPGFDRRALRAAIDDAQVGHGAADVSRCLELGARALEDSPLPGKRLVLASDLTSNALKLEREPPQVATKSGERVRPEVVLRDAARGREALPNHALVELKVEPAAQAGPRAFQFTFTAKNFSAEPVKDLEASLKVNGQVVAKGFLDIPPQGSAQKSLTHRFEQGGLVLGEIALQPDALAEDDQRAFVLPVPKELKALVINGAPAAVRYRDEAFFVDAALTAPGSPVKQTLRDPEAGFREDFGAYDAVLLLNVAAPAPEVADRLKAFVEKGGGLFLSMGDSVDPELYNQRLSGVLPRALRVAKTAVAPGDPEADSKAARLAEVMLDHPVLGPFVGRAREGLLSARFYRYVLLEPEAKGRPTQVLATLDDGAPALAVAQVGAGRVMLLTSTVDRDWSDLAIRTSFLPLMQRACAFLTGSLAEREEVRGRVGDAVVLKADPAHKVSRVQGPSGEELPLSLQPDGTQRTPPLQEPGVHRVLDEAGQPVPSLAFVGILDASESDLTRLKPDALATYFGEGSVRTAGGPDPERRTPLWTWLFVVAAGAFFFEGVLLRK